MDLLFTLLSFGAVLAIAVFISIKFNINSSLTPFISVCFAMMFLSLFGCLGFVRAGGWIYFAIAAAAVIYVVYSCKNNRDTAKNILSPGMVFFTAAGVFIILLFAVKQPMYIEWDEFSFWGTSVKLVKYYDEMYTTAQIGWDWAATQKSGLIMNGYLYEFFGSYHEWRAIAGMDILLFSAISTLAAVFDMKKWHKAVPFLTIGFLTPFAFVLYNTIYGPSYIYMSVLADIPMGMIFGAVMCLYYALKDKEKGIWAICLGLAALTFTKDTAFPLAMVAAGIICVDIVLIQEKCDFFAVKKFWGKLINAAAVFITPVVCFIAWTVYLGAVLNVDAVGNVGGAEQMSMFGMLIEGAKQLVGIGTTEKFTTIMGQMYSNYFNISLTVLGTGFRVTIIILAIIAIALVTAEDKKSRLSCGAFALISAAGFVVYYIFIGFCFVFVFKDIESASLSSYERYIYPYYIGWFITSLALLSKAAAAKKQKFYGVARGAVFAITLLMVLRLSNILLVGYTFIDFDEEFINDRREQEQKAQCIMEYIDDTQSNIFFIGQGDDGNRWFKYSSQLLPLQLEYSFGGGTLCLPDAEIPGDSLYYIKISQQELTDYLEENNCGYIFVEQTDRFLQDGFGNMFSDNLEGCKATGSALYKVNGSTFEFIGEVE